MPADSKPSPLYENLDTTFVNLWSLLRNLHRREFIGRVHVESKDYSADIFQTDEHPTRSEIDRAAGTDTDGRRGAAIAWSCVRAKCRERSA